MATSTEQINQLIGGYTDLKAYFEGQKPRWDEGVVAAQSAYAGLAADLSGIVRNSAVWNVTLDPASPEDRRDGGIYHNINDIYADAPFGAFVLIGLPANSTFVMTEAIQIDHNFTAFYTQGYDGTNIATIEFASYVNGAGNNALYGFIVLRDSYLSFYDIKLKSVNKADAAEVWAQNGGQMIKANYGYTLTVTIKNSEIEGLDGVNIVSMHDTIARLMLRGVNISGPLVVIGEADAGVGMILESSVVYSGGAVLRTEGTVGANLIEIT